SVVAFVVSAPSSAAVRMRSSTSWISLSTAEFRSSVIVSRASFVKSRALWKSLFSIAVRARERRSSTGATSRLRFLAARISDCARPLAVNALAPFECFARLVHGDLVVLRGHRLVRLGEGLLRVDDVRVRPAGLVHEVLRRLDAVFGGLTSPRRLFDLFLQLA